MTIRVLLVDDHTMMRDGLRRLLSENSDVEVVGECADGSTAVDLARKLIPDLVLMDVGMPELNGIEATLRIRQSNASVRVLGLSTHGDPRYVQHMLAAGASGYVPKICAYDELLRAVRAIAAGGVYISPEIASAVVERSVRGAPGPAASAYSVLSSREREVLQLVAEGRTSGESARRLSISIKTVETHRRNIVQKLGLHGTAELTKYAIREGLTSLDT